MADQDSHVAQELGEHKFKLGDKNLFPIIIDRILTWLDFPTINHDVYWGLKKALSTVIGMDILFCPLDEIEPTLIYGYVEGNKDRTNPQNRILQFYSVCGDSPHVTIYLDGNGQLKIGGEH